MLKTRLDSRYTPHVNKGELILIIQQISAVLAAMVMSLVAQTAFGAGGDNNYFSKSRKPVGFNEAVALIVAEKYQEAIIPLQFAEKAAKMMLISKIYWGLSIAKWVNLMRLVAIIDRRWKSIQT